MKKIVFILSIIACFKGNISLATHDIVKNERFQNFKNFLDFIDIDENKKKFIIDYFSKPETGIPVLIKNQPKSKKSSNISRNIKLFKLCLAKSPQYPSKLKIDKRGMALALKLRLHTKINPERHIPVFAKFKLSTKEKLFNTFCSNHDFSNYFNYGSSDLSYNVKFPYIKLDSLLDLF